MTRGSEVYIERSTLWVHTGGEHDVFENELLLEMLSVEDDLVVNDLSNETERRLGTIIVDCGHIKIVHEEDEMSSTCGSKNFSWTLIDITLQDGL